MNPILDMLMNAAGGQGVQQLGRQFGLSEDQTQGAMGQLVPALMAGLQRNTSQEGGLDSLLGALSSGSHSQYLENPELLGAETTAADGNAILGHIFGSKDVSRSVAGRVSEQTGIGTDILKRMLPIVATMVMGGLSRQNSMAATSEPGPGAGGFLTSLLDQNRSGGIADEVVGMLGRFLGGR
jgi:hypothetical protein